MMSPNKRLWRLMCLLLLGSCASGGSFRAAPVQSHPGLASAQSVYLPLYLATPAGLLVGGLYPDAKVDPNRNPAKVTSHLRFTADPSVNGSYLWAFASGITYLDGTCQKTDEAGLVAAANRPGRNSVQFMTFLYADKRDWAPPAVHVFNRSLNESSDCSAMIMADPSFSPQKNEH